MIELSNISKRFADKKVLEGLSYVFLDGAVYTIKGRSGCGKSTLLRIIAGLDKEYSGDVRNGGTVSFSFQNAMLFPWLDAVSNVTVGSFSSIPDKKTRIYEAEELLTFLGFDAKDMKKSPSELSGGMQAKCGIARALSKRADVYLFDEPFANLDKDSIKRCRELIGARTEGKTVITVSHGDETGDGSVILYCAGDPVSRLETV